MFRKKHRSNIYFKIINKDFQQYAHDYIQTIDRQSAKSFQKESRNLPINNKKRYFLIQFKGDVSISNLHEFKEKVNAILAIASKEDVCIFSIESGGGTVTSYGELAYELQRLRKHGIHLITTVDQIAASGGYMLAVQGDEVYAAPNAVLGSIGVIVSMPNYKKLLDKVGIEYKDYMAGKNKRPITPYNEPSQEGEENLEKDLSKVHDMFKNMVQERRKDIDIEKVSEGDTFFGQEALNLKMIDGIQTTSDIIFSLIQQNNLIFEIKYHTKEKKTFFNKVAKVFFDEAEKRISTFFQRKYF